MMAGAIDLEGQDTPPASEAIPGAPEGYTWAVWPGSDAEGLLLRFGVEMIRPSEMETHVPKPGYEVFVVDPGHPLFMWWRIQAYVHGMTIEEFTDGLVWYAITHCGHLGAEGGHA